MTLLSFFALASWSNVAVASERVIVSGRGIAVHELPAAIKDSVSGCSCAFAPNGRMNETDPPLVTAWSLGHDKAYIQLNGNTDEFKVELPPDKNRTKRQAFWDRAAGDEVIFFLAHPRASATISCIVKSSCMGQPECEVVSYEGSFVIEVDGRKLVVPVEGWCGC